MDKNTIIAAIQRAVTEDGGRVPGKNRFETLSGISEGQWLGRYWTRWSDAILEAGFEPNSMQEAHSDDALMAALARLTRAHGRFPTTAELKMARRTDVTVPNHNVFDRLGDKPMRMARLRAFCSANAEWADVAGLLPEAIEHHETTPQAKEQASSVTDGYVYMLKLGKHYKVGRTFAVPRRHRQISLELPEKPDVVHAIATDDPEGIEAYWHRRFAAKQTNGEWFALDAHDVKAFRRRKFM